MSVVDLSERQPNLVVNMGNAVHVLPLSLIRDIANGNIDASKLQSAILARALLGELNDNNSV